MEGQISWCCGRRRVDWRKANFLRQLRKGELIKSWHCDIREPSEVDAIKQPPLGKTVVG